MTRNSYVLCIGLVDFFGKCFVSYSMYTYFSLAGSRTIKACRWPTFPVTSRDRGESDDSQRNTDKLKNITTPI